MPELIPFPPDPQWVEFVEGGREDRTKRDALFERYYEMSCKIVAKQWRKLPPTVSLDDATQWGAMGMLRSISKFDPYSGVPFESFAIPSIRGAVLDGLRDLDWLSRGHRRKQRDIDKGRDLLERKLDRPPTMAELAESLDMTEKDITSVMRTTESAKIRSLDEAHDDAESGKTASGRTRFEVAVDESASLETTATSLVYAQAVEWMRVALSPQEQLTLVLYYLEGLTLAEVGKVLGVPESKASVFHTTAVMGVREFLTEKLADAY